MSKTSISIKTAKAIATAWPKASNLEDAMKLAGIKTKDMRNLRRYRALTEQMLSIKLPAHNPKFSTRNEQQCPSTLDLAKAKKHKSFVITSATNNSNLNDNFFTTLELFCKARQSQLLVSPIKYYHNSMMGKKDYYWDERIHPYVITDKDFIISKYLQVSALAAKATAVDPLGGVKPLGGSRSVIYGATSVHMRCLPTHGLEPVKILQTTGSCTSKSYTRTVAGLKAKFHHSFSAVFILMVGQEFFHVQLDWDGKGFTFLNEYWTPTGMKKAKPIEGIVRGDDHAEWQEPHVLLARKNACNLLKPKAHVFHDVWDGIAVSHHTKPIDKVKVYEQRLHLLNRGLDITAKLIDETGGPVNYIIESNHDRHLERYVNEGRHMKEPHNWKTASDLLVKSLDRNKPMLRCYLEDNCKRKILFPDPSLGKLIKNRDISQHGDIGPNGSRPSFKTFAGYIHHTVTGHTHTGWRYQGAAGVGVSTKKMPYLKGMSSWTYCDIFITATGKIFHLFYKNGKSIIDYI